MRRAVVTGSASGIGAAICAALELDAFAVDGWDVASTPPVDVTDERSVASAATRSPELDAVVLAAGVSRMARLVDTTTASWNEQIGVNAFGVFNCLRALVPRMRRGGAIVVVSSVAGLSGAENLSVYCASKFATIGLVQSLAVELGPTGVRVNAVCPMYVRTPMQERELAWEAGLLGVTPDDVMRGYVEATPIGRVAEPGEIADVVKFLVSADSRYMTGSSVTVSGGADI